MKITLVLLGSLSLGAACLVLLNAKSAIHEILAGVGFLSFAIFACAGSVIGAIEKADKRQRDLLEDIARNTQPARHRERESSVHYQTPGIND